MCRYGDHFGIAWLSSNQDQYIVRSILSELYSVLDDEDNEFYLLLKECFLEDQKFRDFELKTFTLSRVEIYDN